MVLLIIQARMGSSRFPGKILAKVGGRPLLGCMLERLRRSRTVDRIVVATTTTPEDDAVERFCKEQQVDCFRGSEADVLDRFYQACRRFGNGNNDLSVVRLTADCPLIDPAIVDQIVQHFRDAAGAYDYVSNGVDRTYPDGMDVEVFSFTALEQAWRDAKAPMDREHVTRFLYAPSNGKAAARFRTAQVKFERNFSHLRWTVDYPEDLELVERVMTEIYPQHPDFSMLDVLEWIRSKPELSARNAKKFTEGYRSKRLKHSNELYERATARIPGATQTLSKRANQFARGLAPLFARRGSGCRLEDVDGNTYLDYGMALGSAILGYAHPGVAEAVSRQLAEGTLFSISHPLEVELAETLAEIIPCAEMARFAKNGSDATAGAVRAARAYTGREHVALCGYHGWQDWYVGTTSWHKGVPESTRQLSHTFAYNDLSSLDKQFAEHPGKIAAVVLEPVSMVPPQPGFLQGVVDLAHRNGALVIFDEIVTGFRLRIGGAQELFGVRPDLACFGKAMANGFPLAAVVGRKDVMQVFESVFFSFTYGGEALSLAAAQVVIRAMRSEAVIEHLWRVGERLQEECRRLIEEFQLSSSVRSAGYPPRHVFRFFDASGRESLVLKTLFLQETVKRGILTLASHNLSWAHKDTDIDLTLAAYREVFQVMRQAVEAGNPEEYLQVDVVEPVFRPV